MKQIALNRQIFREYDIRGTVDRDLSNDFAYLLGRAYGGMAREQDKSRIAIGHDCRISSPDYAMALARGIRDSGLKVFFCGMGPTPQLYFTIFHYELDGGIQVTGSHNPPDMNGFKICLGKKTLSGESIQNIFQRMSELNQSEFETNAGGSIEDLEVQESYISYLVDNVRPHIGAHKRKVVLDAGNGAGGPSGVAVLERLGFEVVPLFCEPDGNFPNHHPDPTEIENLGALISKVKEVGADVGIGFDGDADRIGAVDEQGRVIFGDMLLLLYGREILKDVPGATIIGDVKCSSQLFEQLSKAGAEAVMWKTGHSLIKQKLQETGGSLAGEMSGHIFFQHRYLGYDDALYAAARLMEILSNDSRTLSELLADVPPMFNTPEIRVDCPEEIKFLIAKEAQSAFSEYKVNTIDGVRIEFERGWGLVRASNTQPVLVMRFEAETEELLNEYQSLVESRVDEIKGRLS